MDSVGEIQLLLGGLLFSGWETIVPEWQEEKSSGGWEEEGENRNEWVTGRGWVGDSGGAINNRRRGQGL